MTSVGSSDWEVDHLQYGIIIPGNLPHPFQVFLDAINKLLSVMGTINDGVSFAFELIVAEIDDRIAGDVALQGQADDHETRITELETVDTFETIQVIGTGPSSSSSATCPLSHPFLIGGSYSQDVTIFASTDVIPYDITPEFDVLTNTYRVSVSNEAFSSSISVQAFALCANFP